MNKLFVTALSLLLVSVHTQGQQRQVADYEPYPIQKLPAIEISRHDAAEAGQGAAADRNHFYAIVNSVIGKYSKVNGAPVARWVGARNGPVRHLNSCYVEQSSLYCANSNFPEIPMASSIEVFDTQDMTHSKSLSLGILEEGSLTWFDRLGDGWIAGYAHYDGRGGLEYKDHSYASIIRYDARWRRMGGWMIPDTVIERMQPYAASGGALGPDGLLYLTGHDRPEMYVLAAPVMGPKLVHIATIDIDMEGQAFAWDKSSDERILYGISRPNRQVRGFAIPDVEIPSDLKPLTRVDFEL